jgi:hypothetical protein
MGLVGMPLAVICDMKPLVVLLLLGGLTTGGIVHAQARPSYSLPDTYRFDYDVTQVMADKKTPADSSVMHFYFTKSGDYAATRTSPKDATKGNLLIVFTREGQTIIFDEHRKTITVLSIRKLVSDLAGMAKWIKMDSLMAHMHHTTDGKDFQSMKTGKSKQMGSYTSEEYTVSGNQGHHGSVWCAQVDFNTPVDYILGATGGNFLKMMGGGMATHPLLQTLTKPKTLVTSFSMVDSSGMQGIEMHTLGIDQTSMAVSTSGYAVSDYSNMTLPEIFQAEMKKRNH